jgi:hypothetical protein
MSEIFNAQSIFENPSFKCLRTQCKDVLRKTYIRPVSDIDKKIPVLQDKYQRKLLRNMLITRENQLRMHQSFKYDKIPSTKINELVHRFFLEQYLQASKFFIAGGFLLRMLEEPDKDIGEIAEQHDIDVFFHDEQDVYNWITTLRANKVTVESIGEKKWHNLFKCTTPSEERPFLIQFTQTRKNGIYELLETFDFPICQIGVDNSRRCFTTFGFDVAWENRADAVTILHKTSPVDGSGGADKHWEKRLKKYEDRGYRFKFVPELVYYERVHFTYGQSIKESEIKLWGKVDKFFESQAWCGGETWMDRVKRHRKEEEEEKKKEVVEKKEGEEEDEEEEEEEEEWMSTTSSDDS